MSNDRKVAIMVAAHKAYAFPSDEGYVPVHVGKALSQAELEIAGDNSGENISELNPYFCELTGLYWMWKNVQADYYGLVHYRRYFKPVDGGSTIALGGHNVASSAALASLLNNGTEVVLSKRRNYWVESIESHYTNAHNVADLTALREVVKEVQPDYVDALESVLKGRSVALYKMFVMPAQQFNAYCEWLFSILLPLKDRINYQEYGPYQRRVFGFLAERLLNVWVGHNIPKGKVRYSSVVNLEGENLVVKAKGLLARKFLGAKQA